MYTVRTLCSTCRCKYTYMCVQYACMVILVVHGSYNKEEACTICVHNCIQLHTHTLLYRRDRLWIAMEYCGGGSLQDIYHGELHVYRASYK